MTAYRGRLLTPLDEGGVRFLDDARLVLEAGRIASVAPFAEGSGEEPVVDLRPRLLVPGFVDTHVHYPQTRAIGRADGPLLDWLEGTIFPEEARFRDQAYAREVASELCAHLAAAGTTTAAVFGSSHEAATSELFAALARSGLRAFAGLTLMDQACPEGLRLPRAEALAACARLADAWHGHDDGRLRFAVTPRFALACSRPLLEDAARFAEDRGLLVQSHISENLAEDAAVRQAHPYARDYLGVYEAAGLCGPRTLLAHAVHLGPGEWDRVAARGVAIAHCPDSNFFLGSGRMRLAEAHARGVHVGLGSDVAAGRSFDLRRAMSSAHDTALCLGDRVAAADLFHLATLGGARALGLSARIGSLEPGKEADFLALRLPAHIEGEAASLATLAFSDLGGVTHVFVRGRQIHRPA